MPTTGRRLTGASPRDEPGDTFIVPPVDPVEEMAFLERRLADLLERNAAHARHIKGLEARIAELESERTRSRQHRVKALLRRWWNRLR